MVYLKVLDADGIFSAAEAIENPVYIKYQSRNSLLLRCPALHAQGILSADGSTAYMLEDKNTIPGLTHTASIIGLAEYEQLKDTDPEDDNPVPPDDLDTEVLTRAELMAKVQELEDQLAAAKILLGVE